MRKVLCICFMCSFSEVLSSLLISTLSLVTWHGLPIQGPNFAFLCQNHNSKTFFDAIFLRSTVFAAVTIDGKVHVFDLHHDKYKPLCVQVKISNTNTNTNIYTNVNTNTYTNANTNTYIQMYQKYNYLTSIMTSTSRSVCRWKFQIQIKTKIQIQIQMQ